MLLYWQSVRHDWDCLRLPFFVLQIIAEKFKKAHVKQDSSRFDTSAAILFFGKMLLRRLYVTLFT